MTATYPLHLQALRHSLVLLAETLVDGWPRDLRQPRSGATAEESRRAQTWATQMQAERGRLLQALLQAFDVVYAGKAPSDEDIVALCGQHDPVALIVRYGRVGAAAMDAAMAQDDFVSRDAEELRAWCSTLTALISFRAVPALSRLLRSPAHYVEYLARPPEPTPAMQFGSAFHAALLEPERYEQVISECHEFTDRFPDSKLKKEVDDFLNLSQKNLKINNNEQVKTPA